MDRGGLALTEGDRVPDIRETGRDRGLLETPFALAVAVVIEAARRNARACEIAREVHHDPMTPQLLFEQRRAVHHCDSPVLHLCIWPVQDAEQPLAAAVFEELWRFLGHDRSQAAGM